MEKDDFLMEEYKYLCKEKERYYKERDYTTIASLTIGIPLIGFGIIKSESMNSISFSSLYFLIPLILFLYLFVRHYWTELLALKADSYIKYIIEKNNPHLNWFTKKSNYNLNPLRQIHKIYQTIVYLAIIGVDLFLIFDKNGLILFLISTFVTLITFISTILFRRKMNGVEMMKKWENRFMQND